jgi:hypothetical protein
MDGDAENPDVAAIYVQERQRELGGEETDKEPDEGLLDSDNETGGEKGREGGGGGGGVTGGTGGEGGTGSKKPAGEPAAKLVAGPAAAGSAVTGPAAMLAASSSGGGRKRADTECSNKSTGDFVSGGIQIVARV